MNTTAIATNMNSIHANNIFNQNQVKATSAFNKVATGLRINSVAQSPSDWSISEKMREHVNSLNQANRNIQNDTALLKTAEGAISSTVDILRSLRDKAVSASDASKTDADRVNIAKEMLAYMRQIDYNATSTRYNDKLLLAQTTTEFSDVGPAVMNESDNTELAAYVSANDVQLSFQIGDDANAVISGITLQNMTLAGLGLTGDNLNVDSFDAYSLLKAIAEPETAFTGTDDTNLKTAIDPAFSTTPAADGEDSNATKLQNTLKAALDTALQAATDVGSLEARLGYTADNVATQIENLQASDSANVDADMAQEISEYAKWNVMSQAAQYMLAQSNQNAYAILNLLQ